MHPGLRFIVSAGLCLLTLASVPRSAAAQTSAGELFGRVKDPSGAVLAGAVVASVRDETSLRTQTITDDRGDYRLGGLLPGLYHLEVTNQGFKRAIRHDIRLAVQQQVQVDITLDIGDVAESIDVVAPFSSLDVSTSSLGKVVDRDRIQALPLDTRNIYSLVYLTPGVAGDIGTTHRNVLYSVNGTRAGFTDTVIDGSSASFPTVNGQHGVPVFPSVDAVQEFKVQAGNYAAEFGRSLGGVLNLVTASGTNTFRGTAYDFYRNSRFDENTFFNKRRGAPLPDFSRSQFGGMVAGPWTRDRTFFMVSYEGQRSQGFRELLTTVPTLLERAGDFSQTRGANGLPVIIYDPATTTLNAAGTGYLRTPFPGNRIPRERMDPVALSLTRYWPMPNQPGDPTTGRNNFSATGVQSSDNDNIDVRVDRVLAASRRIYGRYSYRRSADAPPQFFPGASAVAEGRSIQSDRGQNAVLDYSDQLGRGVLVNARLGFSRTHFVFQNQSLGFSTNDLGLPADIAVTVDQPLFPAFAVGDVNPLGGSEHRNSAFNSYDVTVSVSGHRRSHFVKMGYDGRVFLINVAEARAAPTFSFGRIYTQGPNPLAATTNGGHGFATLLLGAGTQGSLIQNWKNVASQSLYHAFYVQDDWRITDRLTLNAGVRYDFDTPRTERHDRMSWFDPSVRSPLADAVNLPDLHGGLQFVGVDGHPREQYSGDWNNVAPRLGAAYLLTPKTVARAAFGRFFGPSSLAAQGTVGPYGFRTETPWVSTLDGLTPANLLRNPYPDGFRPVPGAGDGLMTGVGGRIEAPLRDTETPNTWQWSAGVQQEIPGRLVVEAAYVANRGRDLAFGGEDGYTLNQLDPRYLSLGVALNELVPNPFYGHVTSGLLAQPTVRRGQLLRPYPQFGDIIPLFVTGARSSYDALQTSVSRRFGNGVAIEGSYVASRSTDWGQSYQNTYAPRDANALSAVHVPYRVVVSGIYAVPYRDRPAGSPHVSIMDTLLGGWQIGGLWRLQAGPTLSVIAANSSGAFAPVTRANWNGVNPFIDQRAEDKLNRWFDTSAFSQPAPFTFGTAPERVPGLRAHNVDNIDLSILKDMRRRSRMRLELRLEAFNLLNRVQFGAPNATVGSGTFGQVTSQANSPRQVQIGLKARW